MPDIYGGNHEHTVEGGIRCVKMDPVTVLMTMGMATERLGLGSTCSTTYYEPFHVARVFATLDLMSKGRAAWNIVTSLNDGEAMNMGRTEVIEHDARYDRADEFLEIMLGHWNFWEDDAILNDKANRHFADCVTELLGGRRLTEVVPGRWATGGACNSRSLAGSVPNGRRRTHAWGVSTSSVAASKTEISHWLWGASTTLLTNYVEGLKASSPNRLKEGSVFATGPAETY